MNNSDCIEYVGDDRYRCRNTGVVIVTVHPPVRCSCQVRQYQARPGTELRRLLCTWGFTETETCGCDEFASKMDRWGVDGCTEHLDTDIVPWMVEQFEKRRAEPEGLSVTAKAIVATTPKLLVPVLARRLVKRAIRTARRKQAKNDYQAPHANRH